MENSNISILVVDDNATERKLMRTYLNHRGYRVMEAENGLKALEIIRRTPPDIILSDLEMPQMDGLQLLARVKMISAGFHSFLYRVSAPSTM